MTITKLSYAVKNPNNVNVFLDGKYWVNVSANLLLELQLVNNLEVDADLKLKVEQVATNQKLYEKIVNWCGLRPHSRLEVKQRMQQHYKLDANLTADFLIKLEQQGLINDEEFAKWFVESKIKNVKNGPAKLESFLLQKGISQAVIKTLVTQPTQTSDKLVGLATKILSSLNKKDPLKIKSLFISRMVSKGYSFKTASKLYLQVSKQQFGINQDSD